MCRETATQRGEAYAHTHTRIASIYPSNKNLKGLANLLCNYTFMKTRVRLLLCLQRDEPPPPLINGSSIWGGDMLLHGVINGCSVVWRRHTGAYVRLCLCLTRGSAAAMAFFYFFDGRRHECSRMTEEAGGCIRAVSRTTTHERNKSRDVLLDV